MTEPRFATDDVVQTIAALVAPYLGDTMARSAVDAQRAKLGFDALVLDKEQVEALIAKVGLGLNVFVGRQLAGALVGRMREQFQELPLADVP